MCKVPIYIISITLFLVLQSVVSLHQILMLAIPTKGKSLAIKTSFSIILTLMVALLKILICIISIRVGRLSFKTFFPIILALFQIPTYTLQVKTSRSTMKTLFPIILALLTGGPFSDFGPHTHNKYQKIQNQNIQRQTLYNVQKIWTNHLSCIHMK